MIFALMGILITTLVPEGIELPSVRSIMLTPALAAYCRFKISIRCCDKAVPLDSNCSAPNFWLLISAALFLPIPLSSISMLSSWAAKKKRIATFFTFFHS